VERARGDWQTCQGRGLAIVRGAVSPDHIHMRESASPELSPANLAQYIKRAVAFAAESISQGKEMGKAVLLRVGGPPTGACFIWCSCRAAYSYKHFGG
jgi:hypothetical protein